MRKADIAVGSAAHPSGTDKRKSVASENSHHLRILNSIRQIIRAVDVDSRRLASDHKVTGSQLMCLRAVVDNGAIKAVDIAKRVHFSPSTLVGVLDRLEAKGLIRRERNAQDRREVSILATDAGRRVVSEAPFPLQGSLGRSLSQLSGEEREELAGWMERLVDLLEAGELSAGSMLEISPLRKRQG